MKSGGRFNLVLSKSPELTTPPPSFVKTVKSSNLFQRHSLHRSKINPNEIVRTYDYVGVKELKSYYERVRKQGKESKRTTSMSMFFGVPRASSQQKIKEESLFLNQQQLISLKTKENSQNQSIISKNGLNKQNETSSSLYPSKHHYDPQNNSFSLQKLKKDFNDYQDLWDKREQEVQIKKGLPSILKTLSNQQEKLDKKNSTSLHFLKNNISFRMWETTLRQKQSIRDIFCRKSTGCKINKKMIIKGKNKLDSESNWVQRKGDDGYQFRLITDHQKE